MLHRPGPASLDRGHGTWCGQGKQVSPSHSEGGWHAGGGCLSQAWRAQPDAIKGLTTARMQVQKRQCAEEHLLGSWHCPTAEPLQLPLPLSYKEGFCISADLNLPNTGNAHNSLSLSTLLTLHILLFTSCIVK